MGKEGNITDALDHGRFDELAHRANLAVNFWTSFKLAAERSDPEAVKVLCGQIRTLTVATFDLVKALGAGGSNG